MAKFNTAGQRTTGRTPITSERIPTGRTHEGAPGHARDPKSELFMLAVTNMVGEATYYENANLRDNRYAQLIGKIVRDDADWLTNFLTWLRSEANMRTAAIVGAAEAAHAMITGEIPGARQIINNVLQRADEPGELLAYWTGAYGKPIPIAIKRGVADAVARLYNERSLLKWDARDRSVRFGDVIELAQPAYHRRELRGTVEKTLFRHAIERRHQRDNPLPDGLPVIAANQLLRAQAADDPTVLLDSERLRAAGMTWEDALSLAGDRVDKKLLWEALAPTLPFMAALRNLRNMDQAGVSDPVAAQVAAKLSDPDQVATSRQFPMRFLSAYRAAPSLRWSYPLEQALDHATSNIPALTGRTLILVDTSGSMNDRFSKDGTLMRWDAAVVFGLALARRCAHADVVSFSAAGWGGNTASKVFPVQRGESLLRSVERWKSGGFFIGGGTDTPGAVQRHYAGHDRVVILTDEQNGYGGSVDAAVPRDRLLVTFNLAGYEHGHAPSGGPNRVAVGGLTDTGFKMLPAVEAGRAGVWPWEAGR